MLNVHIYPSYITNESRMLREAKAIIGQGLAGKIILLGLWKEGLKREEFVTEQIVIRRLRSVTKPGSNKWLALPAFIIFYLKAMRFCVLQKPQVINAHSLTVLPLARVIKWVTGARLIYDPHELETESNDSRGLRQKLAKIVERRMIRAADYTIVVGHHICHWYKTTYGLANIEVIRNIPERSELVLPPNNTLRKILGISEDMILYLYLGALMRGRGIEVILNAFKRTGDPHHIVFVGFGEYVPLLVQESKDNENVHYLQGVPPEKVLGLSSGADVGLSLIENTSLSYYYCLPNKVFEYLVAGIPFIASDFPELRQEFGQEEFCWLISPDEDTLIETLKSIDHDKFALRKSRVLERRKQWSWDEEKEKYRSVYKSLTTL